MADMREAEISIEELIKEKFMFSLCELQDEKNRLISHCRIVNVHARTIELKQTAEDAIDPNLPFGMPVKINVFSKERQLKIFAGIAFGYKDGKIMIAGAEVLRDRERREFFRVPLSEDGFIDTINPLKKKTSAQSRAKRGKGSANNQQNGVKIEDLSLSGLQFYTEDFFDLGDKVIVEFAPLNQVQRRLCEIVRRRRDEDGTMHYGCKFLNMRELDLNDLSKLIMKIQQSARAKIREQEE